MGYEKAFGSEGFHFGAVNAVLLPLSAPGNIRKKKFAKGLRMLKKMLTFALPNRPSAERGKRGLAAV